MLRFTNVFSVDSLTFHIFRLSGLSGPVPKGPNNRGWTVTARGPGGHRRRSCFTLYPF